MRAYAVLARTSRFIDCYGGRDLVRLGGMYLSQYNEKSLVENCDFISCNASEGSSIYASVINTKC